MARWILIFLLQQPVLVMAAGNPKDSLENANALFKNLKYEKAIDVVESVLKSDHSKPDDLVEAYKLTGLCLSARGEEEEAVESFRRLLAIKPGYNLDPEISPKLAAWFYRAKAMSASQPGVSISHKAPEHLGCLGTKLEVTVNSNPFSLIKKVRLRWWGADGGDPMLMTLETGSDAAASFNLPAGMRTKVCYQIEALNGFGGVVMILGEPEPYCLAPRHVRKPKSGDDNLGESQAKPSMKSWQDDQSVVLESTERPGTGPSGNVTNDTVPGMETNKNSTLQARQHDDAFSQTGGQDHWYSSWWFWTAVGVVVAGTAATTTALVLEGSDSVDYEVDICVGCR